MGAIFREQMWRDVQDYIERGMGDDAGILIAQIIHEIHDDADTAETVCIETSVAILGEAE